MLTDVHGRAAGPVGWGRPILEASGVVKIYRTGAEYVTALQGIDLTVQTGEFLAVMGPSGSGKTTLLNCLSGLDDINDGRITVDGEELTTMSDARRTRHRAQSMGFIFQAFNLIPVFTATENVELPLLLGGAAPREARSAAERTLTQVGLGHRLNHRPTELSGGEQQRVTIARALAGRPKIVWADEPTGNLDTETAAQVMGLLGELHREGLTVILVTHDKEIGASAQRRIEVRDGRIVADEILQPPTGGVGFVANGLASAPPPPVPPGPPGPPSRLASAPPPPVPPGPPGPPSRLASAPPPPVPPGPPSWSPSPSPAAPLAPAPPDSSRFAVPPVTVDRPPRTSMVPPPPPGQPPSPRPQ